MLKTTRNALLAFAISTTTLTAYDELSKKEISNIENLNLFKEINIKIKNAYDMGSLYLLKVKVRGNSDEIYLTKDKQHLIAGDVLSTKNGEKLTIPVDLKEIRGKEALTFGTGKDEYFLFTDPQCPYCKKFESFFPQIKDKVKINIFFYPLDFHKEAKDLSLYVMSKKTQKEKEDALLNITANSDSFINRTISKDELKTLEKKLETQMQVAHELDVRGTPAVFDSKGNKVSWVQLLQNYGIEL